MKDDEHIARIHMALELLRFTVFFYNISSEQDIAFINLLYLARGMSFCQSLLFISWSYFRLSLVFNLTLYLSLPFQMISIINDRCRKRLTASQTF